MQAVKKVRKINIESVSNTQLASELRGIHD